MPATPEYIAPDLDLSPQGLSIFTKLFLLAVIVGVCLIYVKSHSPRRSAGVAGRHGAYEKGRVALKVVECMCCFSLDDINFFVQFVERSISPFIYLNLPPET